VLRLFFVVQWTSVLSLLFNLINSRAPLAIVVPFLSGDYNQIDAFRTIHVW
jgi:hypothetical protein